MLVGVLLCAGDVCIEMCEGWWGALVEFPLSLKHNDDLSLSICADTVNSHGSPRHRRTPDNNNRILDNKNVSVESPKYKEQEYIFLIFLPPILPEIFNFKVLGVKLKKFLRHLTHGKIFSCKDAR